MMKSYIPKNIDELFNCLAEMTPNSKIVAGSTDLGIRLQKGGLSPDALLYMGSMKEIRDIVEYNKYVEIGSYVTHTELEKSPIICKYFTAISDAAKDVGSLQIRNNGTIGGNIANASPAGDLLPVLFMLDATVVVATKNKELKDIKISEFILGPGKTVLEVGEAIVKFRINKIDDFISAFIKLGSRKKLTISRIGCTIGITFKESTIDDIKIYIEKINNNEDVTEEIHVNNINDDMEEFMFMGLRMIEGINLKTFKKRFGKDVFDIYDEVIKNNIKKGLLVVDSEKLYLSEKGIELSNYVMSDFILN